jgi:hypothetical protein
MNVYSLPCIITHFLYGVQGPFQLFPYLDEQSFRCNYRNDMNDKDRFVLALSRITGKQLT